MGSYDRLHANLSPFLLPAHRRHDHLPLPHGLAAGWAIAPSQNQLNLTVLNCLYAFILYWSFTFSDLMILNCNNSLSMEKVTKQYSAVLSVFLNGAVVCGKLQKRLKKSVVWGILFNKSLLSDFYQIVKCSLLQTVTVFMRTGNLLCSRA